MGSPLQIRGVPDDDRRSLKARAAARCESLDTYLLRLISREAERPTVAEVLDRAASRAGRAERSAVEVISHARDDRSRTVVDRPSR